MTCAGRSFDGPADVAPAIAAPLSLPCQLIDSTLASAHVPYSYGFAIIALTLLVKAATFPLSQKQVCVFPGFLYERGRHPSHASLSSCPVIAWHTQPPHGLKRDNEVISCSLCLPSGVLPSF